MIDKYQAIYPLQSKEILFKMKNLSKEINYDKIIKKFGETLEILFSKEEYNGVYSIRKQIINFYKWKCKLCSIEFYDHLNNGRVPKCPKCYPKFSSLAEKQVVDYCKSLGLDIIENDRLVIKPHEIDVYLPDCKLAIEYNGLYYHSIKFKNKYYHQNKVKLAQEKGIRLLHIWEHEWIENKEQVKEKIQYYINNLQEEIEIKEPVLHSIQSYSIWI